MSDEVDSFSERRKSLRVDLESEAVRLGWQDASGQFQTAEGICVDLSRRGILLEYSSAFKVGELIEVTFNPGTDAQNTVRGQVCRCIPEGEFFRIAMQLY
ncbi:PilZ domain-containing protein [Shewanella avicenniae]|uniref:PilZ domain-containing protein n=1 Tax=Shewanella avicenniae TaxID=2814294 RepID=A0ABX7QTQ8_9GAMM|nr:PilZ domain-containing protein [Shewanella avicenniae]QSX34872.1 PilZ domain-containing protein [Shewanella avicenniae]